MGLRLRVARAEQGMTLAALSGVTGISASTLSRLESGHRRATLGLLVPVARALGTTLDALVMTDAPPDPRIVRSAITCDGTTIVPLSQPSRGMQAFHHTIPETAGRKPEMRTHAGYEWLYVLRGRLRLLLGTSDLVLTAGEAAEFDTLTPHWFGNAGRGPVRYLTILGSQGERIHVRAEARRTEGVPAAE